MSESENDGDAALREALASLASGPREQSSCGWSAMNRDPAPVTVYVVTLNHHYSPSDLIGVGASEEIAKSLALAHYAKFSGYDPEERPLKWSENKYRTRQAGSPVALTTSGEVDTGCSDYEIEAMELKSGVSSS